MTGIELDMLPCGFCRNRVSVIDGIWDNGIVYHEHCLKMETNRELKKYDKKYQTGDIALKEKSYIEDLQFKVNVLSAISNETNKPKRIRSKQCRSLSSSQANPVFLIPENREVFLKTNQNLLLKKNEELRALRWAFDSYEKFEVENGLVLLDNPEQELKLLKSKNDIPSTFISTGKKNAILG